MTRYSNVNVTIADGDPVPEVFDPFDLDRRVARRFRLADIDSEAALALLSALMRAINLRSISVSES
jgi:hypothetical protein